MENQQKEGKVTKMIEKETSKVSSDIYLGGALMAMGVSMALKVFGKNHASLFVGQWAAPFLLLGVYNKIVKVEGHDRESKPKIK